MSFASGGAFPPSLIPAGKKQALDTNYLSESPNIYKLRQAIAKATTYSKNNISVS